jgi:hypothetical protein
MTPAGASLGCNEIERKQRAPVLPHPGRTAMPCEAFHLSGVTFPRSASHLWDRSAISEPLQVSTKVCTLHISHVLQTAFDAVRNEPICKTLTNEQIKHCALEPTCTNRKSTCPLCGTGFVFLVELWAAAVLQLKLGPN